MLLEPVLGRSISFAKSNRNRPQNLALVEIEATLVEMPPPLSEQVIKLPIAFETFPGFTLQGDRI